jgi:type IV pilus assembly protein PilB
MPILNKVSQLLTNRGKISADQFSKLNDEALANNINPDELLEKNHLVPEEDLARAKSEVYGLPIADLFGLNVDKELLKILPKELAESYQMVVFGQEDNSLKVGLLNPGDFKAREAMDFVAKAKNLNVKYYIAATTALKNILAQYSGLAAEVEEALGGISDRFAPLIQEGKSWAEVGLEDVNQAAPITRLVASILKYAVDNKASDIHIEPFGDKTRVRYRIDGILRTVAMLPGHIHSAIISRIKVMSNLKLDETRIPQDGRIRIVISGRKIDLRVATLPLLEKEKVVMRILDPAQKIFTLEDLGFWGYGLEVMKRNLLRPHGMFLVTGPTGSGKTTTIYAVLKILNKEKVNIITLEDPIEYYMEGINQSQVRPDIGYDFASGIRSVVRQDPNVIMVGEIRDNETAELGTHASLTGHIVLSTLHTNDAFGAIPRMIDMKIEPFLIASSINLILAQRLVRKICEFCREPIEISAEIEKDIAKNLTGIKDINLEEFRDTKTGRLKFYHGRGCGRCGQEGYKGRTVIFEVLEITEEMKKIIVEGCKVEEVKAEFKRQGMLEMRRDGYIKALKGATTIEEIMRVAME